MPTIAQRHKDRIATLDSSLISTGVPTGNIPFGNSTNGSFSISNNLSFTTGTNTLAVGGTINSTVLNVSSTGTIGTLAVTGTASIAGFTSIGGSLTVGGNEVLSGTLTTGSNSISTTNPQGYVNVTALSAGPVGTWLTTDLSGVVNWNAVPNIAAGWTFDGTKIYSNAGVPVRVNSLSAGSEMFNVGGSSIFQANLTITNGGLTVNGGMNVTGTSQFNSLVFLNSDLQAFNGTGSSGQVLTADGAGHVNWQTLNGTAGTPVGGWIYDPAAIYGPRIETTFTGDGSTGRVVIGDDFSAGTNFQMSIRGGFFSPGQSWFGPIGPADPKIGFPDARGLPYAVGMGLLSLPDYLFVFGRSGGFGPTSFRRTFYCDDPSGGGHQEQFYNDDSAGSKRYFGGTNFTILSHSHTSIASQFTFDVFSSNTQKSATINSAGHFINACAAANKTFEGETKEIWGSVVDKVDDLHVGRWKSKGDESENPRYHFTPTAENFYDVFKIGDDPAKSTPGISALDVASIAIAAIQELKEKMAAMAAEIAELKSNK